MKIIWTHKYRDILFKVTLIIFFFIGNITLYAQLEPASDLTMSTSTSVHEQTKNRDTIKDAKKDSFLPVPYFITDQNKKASQIAKLFVPMVP